MKCKPVGVFFAIFCVCLLSQASPKQRSIKTVAKIQVETTVGSVPSLPWQVWVTYSDGQHEWRQVKWNNYPLATEQQQASAELYPTGRQYTISGFIIGDNSTQNGYPIQATIHVTDKVAAVPDPEPTVHPIPLKDVMLTGNNRLTSNRDLDIQNLLSLDITQQLYNYRDTYGLTTVGYTESDGWDSPTTKLKGHGTGHYMSALAHAYASTKDPETKQQLYNRIERMVNELRACQERTFVWSDSLGRYFEARDYAPEEQLKQMRGTWEAFDKYKKDYRHYGYGYLNAIPAAHPALIECYRAYNNEEWVWAPYYTIHKELAGLIDISNTLRPDKLADKAYQIAKDMGLWVWNRLHYRTYLKTDGTKAERQARPGNRYEMWNMYIAGEVGGMEESLARLAEMTNDTTEKARLTEAANYFDSPAFFDPVMRNIDDIRTRHANQHIPMITGALRSYRGNHDARYYRLAQNFWNLVQGRYVYAMGGVGNGEMFRQPYTQMMNLEPNPDINETCCAYNLAKLTKDLNCYTPDDARLMDYYERVLYNQIVGSVHPTEYGVTYQYAVGMNAIKPYGSETPQSSCCGGTGAENHVKYQEATYFVSDNTLWIALYMPTEARWAEKGVTIRQECKWPAEKSTIRVSDGHFAMKLRVPYWATEGFEVRLNGKSVAHNYQPCSYVEIPDREWHSEDVVEVIMPFEAHINWGADKRDQEWVGALMYGPLVMSTPDVQTWEQANVTLQSNLSDVHCMGHTDEDGTNGNLYTLKVGNLSFQPDYYQTDHSTHYLCLNVPTKSLSNKRSKGIDKTELEQAISLAQERQESQEAWEQLNVKIPEFSPWAPNGYKRMQAQLTEAKELAAKKPKLLTQEKINTISSALNTTLNAMRPGNLAEPEDLTELKVKLTTCEAIEEKTQQLSSAINYARMVIQYVNDGSGTKDMIQKAMNRLQQAL